MDRRVFMAILLSVVVVALVYLAFRLFEPFLLSILWAGVLAAVTHGVYARLAGALGRPTLAAALMTLLVFLLIVGPCVLITLVVVDQASRWDVAKEFEALAARPWVAALLERGERLLHEPVNVEKLSKLVRDQVFSVLGGAWDAILFVFGLLAGVAMMLLSLFFFYRDGPKLVHVVRELMPMADEDRNEILGGIRGAIEAAVRGGLLVALVQGILGFVILLVLGRPSPALGAVFMGLASFIPLVGTAVVWLPLALYLGFVEGSVVKACVLGGYGVVVISGSDNVVRPIFLGRHMEAHPLMLFFGVLGGITLFGFAGIVLGPIAVAFLNVATRLLRRRFAAAPSSS